MNNETDTILVEIASYKDSELLNTVNSALIQADNPTRIHFAICYQDDDKTIYEKLLKYKNCKIKYLSEKEAKGSCFARLLCQKMLDDEKYIYQIDSHMRFIKHWDTKMIEQLLSLNDKKAIISFYPPHCDEQMMSCNFDDKCFDEPQSGGVNYADSFGSLDSYFLTCKSVPIDDNDDRAYKKVAFISAGNFFAFSDAHREILHDPNMYFYGDELPMAIRLFTYGWNIYSSGKSYIYHQYKRKNQSFPEIKDGMLIEEERFQQLLGLNQKEPDLGIYGLGTTRTLKDYEKFSGINFKKKIIHINAELGDFENENYKNKISYIQNKEKKLLKIVSNPKIIEVLIVDIYGDFTECIKSALNSSESKEKVSFIIGTTSKISLSKDECENHHIKSITYFNSNTNYSEILSIISKKIGNGFVIIIDSSVRFLKGWDKYSSKMINYCGKNGAITNWVWDANNSIQTFEPYYNTIKVIDGYDNYLPTIIYDESIDLSKKKTPYQTYLISNGFLFCDSSVIKKIPFDPKLTYNEQIYVYSVRLWTYGINLYYPSVSHFIRIRLEDTLNSDCSNLDILCGLLGINNDYAKNLEKDYKFGLGKSRPLWLYYETIGMNYDVQNKELL